MGGENLREEILVCSKFYMVDESTVACLPQQCKVTLAMILKNWTHLTTYTAEKLYMSHTHKYTYLQSHTHAHMAAGLMEFVKVCVCISALYAALVRS